MIRPLPYMAQQQRQRTDIYCGPARPALAAGWEYTIELSWLMFQMGGIGPMMGQANVFFRYFPEKLPSAIARYQNEGRRLFEVLDGALADIANWCWVRTYKWLGIDAEGFAKNAQKILQR
jgi:glutathione S-transferase